MTLTVIPLTHISLDERGVAWVSGTNAKVREIVIDALAGESVDQMLEQHPYLTRAQIHAALSYYYDHQPQVDLEIKQAQEWANNFFTERVKSPSQLAIEEKLRRAKGSA